MEEQEKVRLDVLLVRQGLAKSRENAKNCILEGRVFVNGKKADKPGTDYPADVKIKVVGDGLPYVGRGGLKLEKALQVFPISLTNAVCMDVGASTGGFTDCMLQNGAARVYSVDVGTDQLAEKLKNDSRVISMEKTNIRYATEELFPDKMDFVSVDVSFISLKLVLMPVFSLMKEGASCVCLVKPQFEAGKNAVGKKGVVKDRREHMKILLQIAEFADSCGFDVCGATYSPIRGPEGNIEYLLYIKKNSASDANQKHTRFVTAGLERMTAEAHEMLKNAVPGH